MNGISKNNERKQNQQFALDLGHVTSLSLENFIVSDANNMAFEHVISYPDWRTPMTIIFGPPKSGKSHLASIWQEKSNAIIATNDMLEELTKQGGVEPVLLENVDLQGFDEHELFHFLNQSIRSSRPVLMTATKPISKWPYQTADVISRARLAASFSVATPDDAQLSQMFVKLFDDRQIIVDPKIIRYLVSRMERSSEEVVALVALMDEIALSKGKPITRKLASEALEIREMNKSDA